MEFWKRFFEVGAVSLFIFAAWSWGAELGVGAGESYATIQAGIDAAVDGDVVVVVDGTYTGEGNRDIDFKGKGIRVRSENGAGSCIIDCEGTMEERHRGFWLHSGERWTAVIEGFTIQNAFHTDEGGGITFSGSSGTVIGCVIRGNTGAWGGGIYGRGSINVINCLITDNESWLPGGGIYCAGGSMKVINCTITGNSCGIPGAVAAGSGSLSVVNSIIWGNPVGGIVNEFGSAEIHVSYSDIEYGYDGVGNINIDPEFVGSGDYHLVADSPCMDVGNNNASGIPGTDIEGGPRVLDGDGDLMQVVDMGAYEYAFDGNDQIPVVSPERMLFLCQVGGCAIPSQTLSIWNGGSGELLWEIVEDCAWVEVTPGSGSSQGEIDEVEVRVDTDGFEAGEYRCVLEIRNTRGSSTLSVEVVARVGVAGLILHVPGEYPNIQAAIDASFDGDEIIVSDGVYTGEGNRDLDFGGKAITVRNLGGAENCIIHCAGTAEEGHRGFSFHSGEGADSVVDGFTIRGGKAVLGAGIYCNGTAPTIKNCIIRDNDAYVSSSNGQNRGRGGGIYGCGGVIQNCRILDNEANIGGGLYNCDGTITDCVISGNSALDRTPSDPEDPGGYPRGKGGGLYGCDAEIVNCTISDNIANQRGGGLSNCSVSMGKCVVAGNTVRPDVYDWSDGGGFASCHGTINDTIIINNQADHGGAFHRGSPILNNCLISGNRSSWQGWGAAGAYLGGSINNCTIIDNSCIEPWRPGVFYRSDVPIRNSIIWGNSEPLFYDSNPSITYSAVEGGWDGAGNIDADPLFVSVPDGDYYLSQIAAGQGVDSPCVDAGGGLAVDVGLDGYTTRTDEGLDAGVVDMGYHYPAAVASIADLNGDGVVNMIDFGWFAEGWRGRIDGRIAKGSAAVDGLIGEWAGSEWIMLDETYYGEATDVDNARMALRWDSETDKIYAAVVVHDTAWWFTEVYTAWDASDRIEVYCQGDAAGGTGWGGGDYDVAQQYMVGADGAGGAWAAWGWGEAIGEDAGFEYAVSVSGDMIIYEVGVSAFDHNGGLSGGDTIVTDLHSGAVVGFDLVVDTRWASAGFGMLSENLMTGKSIDAGQFARYVLIDTGSGAGRFDVADQNGNGIMEFDDLVRFAEEWLWGVAENE